MSSPFITTDGCTIAYTLHAAAGAQAPRVVLIHSLALDRSIWDGVVAALEADTQILTLDCRGHGRSDRPHMRYSPQLFARDVNQLMAHIGWSQAVIAGCSMGGLVAQALAIEHPDRCAGLVLIDTTAWYGADAPTVWRERGATGKTKGMAALVAFQTERWFSDAFRGTHPAIVERLTRIFTANDVDCYAETCAMLGDADLRAGLSRLQIPTMVIVGEEDYATPVAMAEALQAAISGASLHVLTGGRHITPTEKPQDIAAHIRSILKRACSNSVNIVV